MTKVYKPRELVLFTVRTVISNLKNILNKENAKSIINFMRGNCCFFSTKSSLFMAIFITLKDFNWVYDKKT